MFPSPAEFMSTVENINPRKTANSTTKRGRSAMVGGSTEGDVISADIWQDIPGPGAQDPAVQSSGCYSLFLVTPKVYSAENSPNFKAVRRASLLRLCADAKTNHNKISYHSTLSARESSRRSKTMRHASVHCARLQCEHTLTSAATSGICRRSLWLKGPEGEQDSRMLFTSSHGQHWLPIVRAHTGALALSLPGQCNFSAYLKTPG